MGIMALNNALISYISCTVLAEICYQLITMIYAVYFHMYNKLEGITNKCLFINTINLLTKLL